MSDKPEPDDDEMKTWDVAVIYPGTHWVTGVRAKTKEEAEEIGFQRAHVSICHQCSSDVEIEDPTEAEAHLREET